MVAVAGRQDEPSRMTTTVEHPHEALDWCRDVTRSRAGNFYWGLRLLPEPRRSALYALYAWMRRVDDIADEPGDPRVALEALDRFSDDTRDVLEGRPHEDTPMWTALSWINTHWSLSHAAFEDMIRGQQDDLEGREVATGDDLIEYCRRVASTVGVLCVSIWGYSDDAALDLAVDRGVAFQLTNILRDLHEDLDRGRCYLPADECAALGLDPQALRTWQPPEDCRTLIERWIAHARDRYLVSAPLDDMIDGPCRATLAAMTEIYRAILVRLADAPHRSGLGPSIELGKLTKIRIAWRAWRSSR